MERRKISEVAAEIGVSAQTLRVWEKEGVLVPDRTEGGQRRYTPDQVARARKIADLRQQRGWNPAAIKASLVARDDVGDSGDADERHSAGQRLRRARLARGLSLAELAEGAEISVSYLSSIERGIDHPSTRVVARLTDTLGIPLSGLADFTRVGPSVVRAADRTPVHLEGGATWEEMANPSHELEAAMLTVSPSGSSGGRYARPGETFVHVVEGALRFELGGPLPSGSDTIEELCAGDSITVPPRAYLSWINDGSSVARAIWIELLPPHAWGDPMTRRIVEAASGTGAAGLAQERG